MNFGFSNIAFVPLPETGGPFSPGAANNGLSVDSGTGKIVFGNNFADASPGAAVLFNDRKIDFPDSTTVRYRMQIPNVQTQDETLDFGGAAGMGITFNGQNLTSPNETQRLPFQAYVSNTRTGGYSVGFQAGRTSQVAVKLTFVDSATQLGGLRGGNLQVLNNSGTATLSQLNFVVPSDGGFVWRINPAAANNNMVMFNNGNVRIGAGADSGARLQVQGSGGNIEELYDSGGALRWSISNTGVVTMAAINAAPTVNDFILIQNSGNNTVRRATAFNGTVTPVTSITVVNGIITAVS